MNVNNKRNKRISSHIRSEYVPVIMYE